MAMTLTLAAVMDALGQTGNTYLEPQIQPFYEDVINFLKESGVPESRITVGIVARGVSDLWNYGAGNGKLSTYFLQRATQLYTPTGGA